MQEKYRSEPLPIDEALRNLTAKVENQRKVIDKLISETKKLERIDGLITLTKQVGEWMTELIAVYRYVLKHPHDASPMAAEMRGKRTKLTGDIEGALGEIERYGGEDRFTRQMRSNLVCFAEMLERENRVDGSQRALQGKGASARERANSRWFRGRSQ